MAASSLAGLWDRIDTLEMQCHGSELRDSATESLGTPVTLQPMRNLLLKVSCIAMLVMLLASCKKSPSELRPIRIGFSKWPSFELAYLARDLGYLEGVSVVLVDTQSTAEENRAYRAGLLDVIATTNEFAIENMAYGADDQIVFVIDESAGADALVAGEAIKTLEDLKGKRIGIDASAIGLHMLRRALKKANLTEDDIVVVAIDHRLHSEYLAAGKVEALVTWEPELSRAHREGAHTLFSSKEIPGEIVDVLLTKKALVEARASDLRSFVDAWYKAKVYLETHPDDAARRVAAREGLTPEEYLQSLRGIRIMGRADNQRLLGAQGAELLSKLNDLSIVMLDLHLLPRAPMFSETVTDVLVRP